MKTFVILLAVIGIVVCYSFYNVMNNAITESAKLRCSNAKLDNTVKTQAKTIKDLSASIVSQKTTIEATSAENNAKDDKIKQLAVRIVNLQSENYKLRNTIKTKSRNKIKPYIRKKIKVYRKPVKTAQQLRNEKEVKFLEVKKSKAWGLYLKYKKEYAEVSGHVGGSPRSKKNKQDRLNKIKYSMLKYYNEYKRLKKKIDRLK